MKTFPVDSTIVSSNLCVVVSWYNGAGCYEGKERTTLVELRSRLGIMSATVTYQIPGGGGRIGYRLATGEVARVRF